MLDIWTRLIGAALFAVLGSAACAFAETTEQIEPPLLYQLKIGELTIPVSEGIPVTIEGTFANPAVTLAVADYRVFPHGGVEFRYPRHFTFEADLSAPGVKIWTLSGNSFKIMYFVTSQALTVDAFIESLSAQAEPDQVKVDPDPIGLQIGGQTVPGKRVTLTLAGQSIVTDAYALPASGNLARLLVFQDSPQVPGTPTAEALGANGLLTRSFVLKP